MVRLLEVSATCKVDGIGRSFGVHWRWLSWWTWMPQFKGGLHNWSVTLPLNFWLFRNWKVSNLIIPFIPPPLLGYSLLKPKICCASDSLTSNVAKPGRGQPMVETAVSEVTMFWMVETIHWNGQVGDTGMLYDCLTNKIPLENVAPSNVEHLKALLFIIIQEIIMFPIRTLLVGDFNPSGKYESQLLWLFPIVGKITHVPNQQPVLKCTAVSRLAAVYPMEVGHTFIQNQSINHPNHGSWESFTKRRQIQVLNAGMIVQWE